MFENSVYICTCARMSTRWSKKRERERHGEAAHGDERRTVELNAETVRVQSWSLDAPIKTNPTKNMQGNRKNKKREGNGRLA